MPSPANDNFVNATPISGAAGNDATSNNIGATNESGEPANNGKTVWWKWTGVAGAFFFSTAGNDGQNWTNFKSAIQVFTANDPNNPSVSTLTEVPYIYDQHQGLGNGFDYGAMVAFNAALGAIYYIRVDTRDGNMGNIFLNWDGFLSPFLSPCSCVDFNTINECYSITLPYAPPGTGSLDVLFGNFSPRAGLYNCNYCSGGFAAIGEYFNFLPQVFLTAFFEIGDFNLLSAGNIIWKPPIGGLSGNCLSSGYFFHPGGDIIMRNPGVGAGFPIDGQINDAQMFVGVVNGQPIGRPPSGFEIPVFNDWLNYAQSTGLITTEFPFPNSGAPTFTLSFILMWPSLSFTLIGPQFYDSNDQFISFRIKNNNGVLTWPNVSVQMTSPISLQSQQGAQNLPPNSLTGYNFVFPNQQMPYTIDLQVQMNGVVAGTVSYTVQPVVTALLQYVRRNVLPSGTPVMEYHVQITNSGLGISKNLKYDLTCDNPNVKVSPPTHPDGSPNDLSTYTLPPFANLDPQASPFGGQLGPGSTNGFSISSTVLDGKTIVNFYLTFHDDTFTYPPFKITQVL